MKFLRILRFLFILSISFSSLQYFLPVPNCFGKQPKIQSEKPKILRFLLVPEQNTFEQRRRYKFITEYLSRRMGVSVTSKVMADYGEISLAFQKRAADAGFFGSFSYVLTHAKAGIEPIARPVWLNGSSTYQGYIFVRKDSNIQNARDMQNKNLVLVDKATTAGYIFQRFYFKFNGIDDMDGYFSRVSFARSHDAAAWAVYTGEADIGGAKNHIFNSLREKYPDFRDNMVVLAESPEVPSNGLAVSKDLNPALKLRLKTLLLSMHETSEGQEVLKDFGALRFVETTDSDYEVLYKMVEQLGINLADYSN